MLLYSIKNVSNSTQIEFICDNCKKHSFRSLGSIRGSWHRTGVKEEWCTYCSRKLGASKRPQNTSEFTKQMRSSPAYYIGIKQRPSIVGEKNPNFGKKVSSETSAKMSISRTGKTGSNATAWKGGKLSFNKRIKSGLQRRYKWFHRVIDRDGCCTKCGITKNLDAHHIIPISKIIKKILLERINLSETEQYEFIISHKDIVDKELTNGLTLCRQCHKIEHTNWGSHEPI